MMAFPSFTVISYYVPYFHALCTCPTPERMKVSKCRVFKQSSAAFNHEQKNETSIKRK